MFEFFFLIPKSSSTVIGVKEVELYLFVTIVCGKKLGPQLLVFILLNNLRCIQKLIELAIDIRLEQEIVLVTNTLSKRERKYFLNYYFLTKATYI